MKTGAELKARRLELGITQHDLADKIGVSRSMKKEYYLKMNENEDVSFNDLIDAAVQAKKDGVCDSVEIDINNWLIVKSSTGNIHCHKNHLIHDNEFHINWIKSLYTEKFVIEKMIDEFKIKSGAELTLANGMKCIYFDDGDRKLRHDGDFYPCNFLVLKGATVKQSKGAK